MIKQSRHDDITKHRRCLVIAGVMMFVFIWWIL